MNPIEMVFGGGKRKALVAYVTLGYPDIETTLRVVPLLVQSGCDIIELGIPFSDPLADGATIQKASHHALQNGITVQACLDTAGQLSASVHIPLVFMTYYNPVARYDLEKFCNACVTSRINGLIIPDLPPEEGRELESCAASGDIYNIYLLAPTSTPDRVKLVAAHSRGFIYLVSVSGVTGTRDTLPKELTGFIANVRAQTAMPLCVGFGISSPEQAQEIARQADGIIIGSRIIQLMEEDKSLRLVQRFISDVRTAIDSI